MSILVRDADELLGSENYLPVCEIIATICSAVPRQNSDSVIDNEVYILTIPWSINLFYLLENHKVGGDGTEHGHHELNVQREDTSGSEAHH